VMLNLPQLDPKHFFIGFDSAANTHGGEQRAPRRSAPKGVVWNGTDMIIKWNWELPVPVAIEGSILSYSFSTTSGDIEFAVFFLPNKQKQKQKEKNTIKYYDEDNVKTEDEDNIIYDNENQNDDDKNNEICIIPWSRVTSDTERITGELLCPRSGILKLRWNNDYSWFLPKWLTYRVVLQQNQHSIDDYEEAQRARRAWQELRGERSSVRKRLSDSKRLSQVESSSIITLEQRLLHVQLQLQKAQAYKNDALDEIKAFQNRIIFNEKKMSGLCIRCIKKEELVLILSYCDATIIRDVCKYWRLIYDTFIATTTTTTVVTTTATATAPTPTE
jgi:hypothetical protein